MSEVPVQDPMPAGLLNVSSESSSDPFRDKWLRILIFGLIAGILIRIVLGYIFTFSFDTTFWLITSDSVDAYGSIYQGNGFWYPPVWGYILSAVSLMANFIGIDTGLICYDLSNVDGLANIPSMYVISPNYAIFLKSILFVFDLINTWLIYRMVSERHDVRKASIAALLWFLCPLVIWSSTIACQIDVISATFLILSVYFLLHKRYFIAGIMITLGFFTKLFPICLMFMFVAYVMVHSDNGRDKIKNLLVGVLGSLITVAVVLLPFIAGGEISTVFSFYSGRVASVSPDMGSISSYSPIKFNNIVNYIPLLLVAMVFIAWRYHKTSVACPEKDRELFIKFSLLTFLLIFLFGQSLTYPVIMVPLLAYFIIAVDSRLSVSYVLLSVISVLYCFSNFNVQLLYSASIYWNWMPLESLMAISDSIQPMMDLIFNSTAILGILPSLLAICMILLRRYSNEKV